MHPTLVPYSSRYAWLVGRTGITYHATTVFLKFVSNTFFWQVTSHSVRLCMIGESRAALSQWGHGLRASRFNPLCSSSVIPSVLPWTVWGSLRTPAMTLGSVLIGGGDRVYPSLSLQQEESCDWVRGKPRCSDSWPEVCPHFIISRISWIYEAEC